VWQGYRGSSLDSRSEPLTPDLECRKARRDRQTAEVEEGQGKPKENIEQAKRLVDDDLAIVLAPPFSQGT
jgi:hypothetical protein